MQEEISFAKKVGRISAEFRYATEVGGCRNGEAVGRQLKQAARIGELTANQKYAAEILRDLVAEDPEMSDWLKVRIDAWLKCVEQLEQQEKAA